MKDFPLRMEDCKLQLSETGADLVPGEPEDRDIFYAKFCKVSGKNKTHGFCKPKGALALILLLDREVYHKAENHRARAMLEESKNVCSN